MAQEIKGHADSVRYYFSPDCKSLSSVESSSGKVLVSYDTYCLYSEYLRLVLYCGSKIPTDLHDTIVDSVEKTHVNQMNCSDLLQQIKRLELLKASMQKKSLELYQSKRK
jgi:hypothetical protein